MIPLTSFATSFAKVNDTRFLLAQNRLLRSHATGDFETMLVEISRDPAMLEYLDNKTNRQEHPNENFAREVMELFVLGIGHYTEQDIKEAARAFTGWTNAGNAFVERARWHDDGEKTVLGRTGRVLLESGVGGHAPWWHRGRATRSRRRWSGVTTARYGPSGDRQPLAPDDRREPRALRLVRRAVPHHGRRGCRPGG